MYECLPLDLILNLKDWSLVRESLHNPPFAVFQHTRSPYKFRITGELENNASTVFDFLTNVPQRQHWDPLVDVSKVVESYDQHTRVVYIRMKPIWPTAARDMLLLSHVTCVHRIQGRWERVVDVK
jgi:hypothetical protein